MKAKVSGSIEAQSREISRHNAVCAIEEGDFSTLWRLCIESPSQPKLALRRAVMECYLYAYPRTPFAVHVLQRTCKSAKVGAWPAH